MKRLNVFLSEEIHTQFKVACALEGTDMSDAIRKFIEEYVKDARKRKLIVLPKTKN